MTVMEEHIMDANHYQVFEIGEKSWRIDEDWTRFFLFEGSERALLVDTGFGQGDAPWWKGWQTGR